MGHFTSMPLVRRGGLSVFRAGYIFASRNRDSYRRLWPSIKRELRWALSLIPLLVCNLALPWDHTVYVVDASPWGCGICLTESSEAQVADIGIHSERWRFKHKEPPIRLLARREICSAIALDKGELAAEDFKRDLAAKFPEIDAEDLHTAVDALAPSNHVPLVDLNSLPASKPWRVCSFLCVVTR